MTLRSIVRFKYDLPQVHDIIIIIYFANEYNTWKKHNEYTIGKTYKAHRALTVALNYTKYTIGLHNGVTQQLI